jgi:hypothetical protein
MSEQLDIVVTSIDAGASEAAKRLAQAFDMSALEAEQFVRELPRVAKRNASREEAARYVEALKAIGARVETLASEAPRATLRARMPAGGSSSSAEQLVIPIEPELPAMRFRAGGHMGMISVPPHDVLHPSFPKDALIPHDLARMPNGELPMPSIRPASAADENGAYDESGEPRRHTNAQMPPPLVLAAKEMAASMAASTSTPTAASGTGKAGSTKLSSANPASAKPARDEQRSARANATSDGGQPQAPSLKSNMALVVGIALLLIAAAIGLGFVL